MNPGNSISDSIATPHDPAAQSATVTESVLQLRNVSVEIGIGLQAARVVDDVSLEVFPGETLGIVGESGCGKSMTAFATIGLLPARGRVVSGSIRLSQQELTTLDEARMRAIRGNKIGMVFQDPLSSLNPTMTVFDQVAEPLVLHTELSKGEIRDRALETLNMVGIPRAKERLSAYPHELSGGLRQRVCIAIALICKPQLLIADEPTTALDVTIQRQILDLIDDLRERLRMGVILVTHDLGVVAGHTDRVAVMYGGRIVETADTQDLFARPRHRYTNGLFAALPERAMELGERLYSIPGQPPSLLSVAPGCSFQPRCAHAGEECAVARPPPVDAGLNHVFACYHPAEVVTSELWEATPARPDVGGAARAAADDDIVVLDKVERSYAIGSNSWSRTRQVVKAVAGVSLRIRQGETFGLVGESGCGKSTIGRIVAGLDKPSSGDVYVRGRRLADLSRRDLHAQRRDVHLMFQDPSAAMDPRMRGFEILLEPFVVQRVGTPSARLDAIARLLVDVGLLPSTAARYPHELSGGQRQRLALGRALALRPSLIVADEPVSALDVSVQAQILNLMRDLQAEFGLTYLFVSHNLSVVRYMSTTIGVMYLGKLVELGPADIVYRAPLHPYTRGLLDSEPLVSSGKRERSAIKGELASAISPPSGCHFHPRCPFATPTCSDVEPELTDMGGGRQVACHYPLDDAA